MTATINSLYGVAAIVQKTTGYREFGVPPGGPFDRVAATYANTISRLPPESRILELALGAMALEVSEPTSFGVAGAVEVIVDGKAHRNSGRFRVSSSLEVRVRGGCRAYVAAGWERATTPMTSGQQLALNPNISPDLTLGPSVAIQSRFHVIDGPQADLFRPDLLTSRPWVASTLMDRVGIRLDGKKEAHDIELPSEPCCFGAIQLTRDGTPIILGPDGPTIGGYPKIAVVISSELSALGQLKPGSPLTFEAVSFEEALSLNSAWEREFSRAVSQLRAGAES